MKKYLANIVTSSRIVGSAILFCCNDFSTLYLCVYCYCGFTDFIDGPIARKTGSASALGAALDTIGDVLTYLSLVKILIVQKLVPGWLLIWLGVLIVCGFGVAFLSLRKFNKFYIPHTYIGKLLGAIVFFLPLAVQIMEPQTWEFVICAFITTVLLEAAYIQLRSKEAKDFVASIFHVNKDTEKELAVAENK